ncbi:Hsp20/alpha crystallin family protein [Dictyobacter aurantiacus]|uniref:SHSP domain-containing protein n=1 Tax=Dictyobacter aurantiacus TaxID=1936993 RepID=A0A401ZH76_9CHLR|nr:Hsp20 family protein [Dictyobacter aurantiacus]GCE06048.1 hypothetical protein KDAU_33770 [Dictyobacter aurantiacus]
MATKGDDQKKQQQKDGEDKSTTGHGSFIGFFRGLESLLNTVITVEESAGEQERKYEGEANSLSGRLKTGFSLSVKTNLLDVTTRPSAEPVRVVTHKSMPGAEPEPFVDFFNEQDHVRIIAELQGIEEEHVHTEIQGDIFILSTSGGSRRAYSKEIVLPEDMDVSTLTQKYTNGILEIRMDKMRHG